MTDLLSFFKAVFFSIFFLLLPAAGFCNDNGVETIFGGQAKFSVSGIDYSSDSIHSEFKDSVFYDADLNLRIKNRTFVNENFTIDCHYLFTSLAGDSMEQPEYFSEKYPGTFIAQFFQRGFDSDETKVMDLSSEITDGDDYLVYHRIDRLNLSFENNFGRITLGRQAVTWGNGLVFNPMDVVNPFSPYDTERDYKKGDDMLHFETVFKNDSDLQFIFAPRRDPESRNLKFSESSTGLKYHLFFKNYEFDFAAIRHYEDILLGMGCIGTLGEAVWRSDFIYTVAGGNTEDDFYNIIINIDYSWVWCNRNFYGFLEYYYSGLGVDDNYHQVYTDISLAVRTERGEMYGLGKNYVSASISIELSPLLNFNITGIVNTGDPSCMIQPRLTWSAAQNFEVTLGANLAFGGRDEEYGYIVLPSQKKADFGSGAFIWATLFF